MNLQLLTYNIFGMPWGLKHIEDILLWCFYKTDAEILCFQELFSREHREIIETLCSKPDSCWTCWFPMVPSTFVSRYSCGYFESITGLCILVKKHIQVIQKPVFQPFLQKACVDRLVEKGFFHLSLQKDGTVFHLVTTHFQSDFTECNLRIRYQDIRNLQEIQLYSYCKQFSNLIVVGDFNCNRFYHFRHVNLSREPTYKETGESLDHCLQVQGAPITCKSATYFHEMTASDHTPVFFHVGFP